MHAHGRPPTGLSSNGKGLKAVPNSGNHEEEANMAKGRQLIDAFLKAHGIQ
jgi:hypothetical protein